MNAIFPDNILPQDLSKNQGFSTVDCGRRAEMFQKMRKGLAIGLAASMLIGSVFWVTAPRAVYAAEWMDVEGEAEGSEQTYVSSEIEDTTDVDISKFEESIPDEGMEDSEEEDWKEDFASQYTGESEDVGEDSYGVIEPNSQEENLAVEGGEDETIYGLDESEETEDEAKPELDFEESPRNEKEDLQEQTRDEDWSERNDFEYNELKAKSEEEISDVVDGVVEESLEEDTESAQADRLGYSGFNTQGTAMNISLNKEYTDFLDASSDNVYIENYYKFKIKNPGYIRLSYKHYSYDDDGDALWWYYIYKEGNENIFDAGIWEDITSDTVLISGVSPGTYYLRVTTGWAKKGYTAAYYGIYGSYNDYSRGVTDANYSFKINYSASSVWEREMNNSIATANKVAIDKKYHGNSGSSDGYIDNDYYSLTLDSEKKLNFNFKHSRIDDGHEDFTHAFEVYKGGVDQCITREVVSEKVESKTVKLGTLAKGTYYICIHRYRDDYLDKSEYSFSVDRVKLNQSLSFKSPSSLVQGKSSTLTINGAKGALSYKSSNPGIISVSKIGKNKCKVSAKSPGTAKITITAAATNDYYAKTSTVSIKIYPAGTAITSCKNIKGKKLQIKWKRNSKVSGYQVQYSRSKAFKTSNKSKLLSGNYSTTFTAEKLSKKTYYVRVRTYKLVGSKRYYSAWSQVKTVKIKK
ncbi:MAG: hypothetical protein IJ679_13060 [Lachnospiraceae bacterium]|nr:hypothetical protein [Lachnospiraceae bacterium]